MKQIVEINGVKLEVDLREAQTIETYRVGDIVKVLIKKYTDTFEARPGAIIGFDNFKNKPTIVVAYLDSDYGKAEVKLVYIHQGSENELTHASPGDVPFSKKQILDLLDKDIADKAKALAESEWRKERFEEWFGAYFAQATPAEQSA